MKLSVSLETSRFGGHPVRFAADGRAVETPPVEHLAYFLTLSVFAAAEVIEWPVALALGAGHFLTGLAHRPALNALGEALDEA
jgi:hypothetical protein